MDLKALSLVRISSMAPCFLTLCLLLLTHNASVCEDLYSPTRAKSVHCFCKLDTTLYCTECFCPQDLCQLVNADAPYWLVGMTEMTRTFGLELLESVLNDFPGVFLQVRALSYRSK